MLDKAVEVIDSLVTGPKSLAELVAVTGLPRATAHRLAVALEHHEFVRRDTDGRFRGSLKSTGIRPKFAEKLADHGIRLGPELFAGEGFARRTNALR